MVMDKNIEMVAAFNKDGKIVPVRFRVFGDDQSNSVFTISRILKVDEKSVNGADTIIFNCISTLSEEERVVELKYMKDTCRWYLYKVGESNIEPLKRH